MTPTRRLAAILAADVAGFSALMERDEEGTVKSVRALHSEIIAPQLAAHLGRLVKTTGDGFLAEFASPLAALRCAIAIHHNAAASHLRLRIGLNLGDVIVEADGDVYGEGVNVAARLEALAEPGGILISGKFHEEVAGKIDIDFSNWGEQLLKNIARPIRLFAVGPERMAPTVSEAHPAIPDKPSLAVLPFINMSGDSDREYVVDGLVEDITTALSRLRWLFVIARNSSFTFKGQPIDVKRVARELGVRYVLQGSVRTSGSRLRVTAQLIQGEDGAQIWAERYDRDLQDMFELQDELTSNVAGAIEPQLFAAEAERAERRHSSDLKAWECVMKALPFIWRSTIEDTRLAQNWLEQAMLIDKNYAYAHALMGWTYMKLWGMVGISGRSEILRAADRSGRTAVVLDHREPWVHLVIGLTHSRRREADQAVDALNRAISLNPNFAMAHAYLGYALGLRGDAQQGLQALDQAHRLSPRDPFLASDGVLIRSMVQFAAGNYEEAVRLTRQITQDRPNHQGGHRLLASSLALMGRIGEARASFNEIVRLDPAFDPIEAGQTSPYTIQATREAFVEGLKKAAKPH